MKTRIIQTKFWADGFVSSLTSSEKLIFNYYLTNERVNIIHCYQCPDKYVLIDTGVSRGVLEECKKKLQENNKVRFYNEYVLLVNADKYESYTGEDNIKAKDKLLAEMSNDVLAWYNNKNNRGVYSSGIPLPINKKEEIISNNKGVVKGITEQDLQDIADKYKVPLSLVKLAKEEMDNWLEAKGKSYKGFNGYKAGLRNWVLRDAKKQIEGRQNGRARVSIDISKI